MAFNAATIAAIVAACWAHPLGVAYLAKIEQIRANAEKCGNPCCNLAAGHVVRPLPRKPVEEEEAFLIALLL